MQIPALVVSTDDVFGKAKIVGMNDNCLRATNFGELLTTIYQLISSDDSVKLFLVNNNNKS